MFVVPLTKAMASDRLELPEMNFPIFKRRFMTYDMHNYYALNTDVWVYGNAEQYQEVSNALKCVAGPTQVVADERGGMDLLLLPEAQSATREFLIIQERLVHQSGRFNMELIIGGTGAGLDVAAAAFAKAATALQPNEHDHEHLDDHEPLLVLPAVFLNIRAPMDDLGEQLQTLAAPDENDLPPDMKWRTPESRPYQRLSYKDLHGRIPIRE